MNSLTFISRQYDVLASPRAPPSTPTHEGLLNLGSQDAAQEVHLKRVRTWSTRSFRVSIPGPPSSRWPIKRSNSLPTEVNALPQAGGASTSASVYPSSRKPSFRRPSVSVPAKSAYATSAADSVLRRVFLVRFILFLWEAVSASWKSLTRRKAEKDAEVRSGNESALEDGTDEEDEAQQEKSVVLQLAFPPRTPPPLVVRPSPDHEVPPIASVPFPTSELLSPASTPSSPTPTNPSSDPLSSPEIRAEAPAVKSAVTPSTQTVSRAGTPPSVALRNMAFHRPKTLVLDLDETLIHSTSRPLYNTTGSPGLFGLSGIFGRRNKPAGHMVEVALGGRSTLYHVYKRPFVDYFLRVVSGWYTLVIFTASMQEYADPVIDWLDAGRGILGRRLFRESCTQLPNGSYTKDLSIIEQDLARVCLIDNSPICYSINEANGIPIEGWTHDPNDEALLDLLPVLDSLRFTNDVRRVLGIRGFS